MPLVTIKIITGRTTEQKRNTAKDVTEAIAKNLNCPASAVHIDFIEMSAENYAQGGKLFSDEH